MYEKIKINIIKNFKVMRGNIILQKINKFDMWYLY